MVVLVCAGDIKNHEGDMELSIPDCLRAHYTEPLVTMMETSRGNCQQSGTFCKSSESPYCYV